MAECQARLRVQAQLCQVQDPCSSSKRQLQTLEILDQDKMCKYIDTIRFSQFFHLSKKYRENNARYKRFEFSRELDFVFNFHQTENLVKMMQDKNLGGFFYSFVLPNFIPLHFHEINENRKDEHYLLQAQSPLDCIRQALELR